MTFLLALFLMWTSMVSASRSFLPLLLLRLRQHTTKLHHRMQVLLQIHPPNPAYLAWFAALWRPSYSLDSTHPPTFSCARPLRMPFIWNDEFFFENSNLIHILLLIVEHSHVSIGITRAPSHTRLSASIRIYILTWASLRTNCLRDQIQRNFLLEPNLLSFFFWFLLISPCMYKFFRLCSSLLRFYLNFIYRMS